MIRYARPHDRGRGHSRAGARRGSGVEEGLLAGAVAFLANPSPLRAVVLLVLAATVVRIAFAAATGLGIDESYMVAAGRVPALGYFDHPPLAWWMSHGIAALAGSEAAVVVRLPFILTAAVTTLLLARLGRLLFSPAAGFWTAVAFTLAPLFGVTSATWVLPDGPLDAALAACLLAIAEALFGPQAAARRWWLAAGLAGGLALLSKYTAVLAFAGVALAMATAPGLRRWYARPEPYLAAALPVLAFVPVIAWNAGHDWASLGFQGSRAAVATFRPEMALVVIGGGALYLLPWIFAGLAFAAVAALRRGPGDERRWLLAVTGLVPIAFFTAVALWSPGRPLPHWAAPGYLALMPLLGDVLARAEAAGARWVRRAAVATAALLVVAMGAAAAAARLAPARRACRGGRARAPGPRLDTARRRRRGNRRHRGGEGLRRRRRMARRRQGGIRPRAGGGGRLPLPRRPRVRRRRAGGSLRRRRRCPRRPRRQPARRPGAVRALVRRARTRRAGRDRLGSGPRPLDRPRHAHPGRGVRPAGGRVVRPSRRNRSAAATGSAATTVQAAAGAARRRGGDGRGRRRRPPRHRRRGSPG
jgi:hypothetical protein